MSDLAIQVEHISKKYELGAIGSSTLRETLAHSWDRLRGRNGQANGAEKEFWALKDINFEVKQGEVVGIIGKNGAGKSTLLKVLSRITEPTTGQIKLNGRIASLLEVGTGFHPELTGRENIFLNGSILGMGREEIKRKFDEIVAFSGVEKFLDTPVKRYSSGMYVRLAFAVAAHLEPEILVIDEVLAVGDAAFQRKCLGKMQDVAGQGRTVLFVSHNMAAVQGLCQRGILLSHGQIAFAGGVDPTVQAYFRMVNEQQQQLTLGERKDRVGGDDFRFTNISFRNQADGRPCQHLFTGQAVDIELQYDARFEQDREIEVSIGFFTENNVMLFACRSSVIDARMQAHPGEGRLVCQIPRLPLNGGHYSYNLVAFMGGQPIDWIKEAGTIDVESGDYYGTGKLSAASRPGVCIDYTWQDDRTLDPAYRA